MFPGSICVPVKSSMVRGNSGSVMCGGPPRSPSAITCSTGVRRVTDRTPMSSSTSASPAARTIAGVFEDAHTYPDLVRILHQLITRLCVALLAAHLALQHFPHMTFAARRRSANRAIILDKSLEALPVFRLSDSADESAITYSPPSGGRWRVLPNPGDRLPGTFDQDVYVEILRTLRRSRLPVRRNGELHPPCLPALDRPSGRRPNVRAAALGVQPPGENHPRIDWSLLCSTREHHTRRPLHNPQLGRHRASETRGSRAVYSVSRSDCVRAWRRAHRRSLLSCARTSRRGVPSHFRRRSISR